MNDLVPDIHAKWIKNSVNFTICSNCGDVAPRYWTLKHQTMTKYCPNCGARMEKTKRRKIDNDIVNVVRCKDCKHWHKIEDDIVAGHQYGWCDTVEWDDTQPQEWRECDYCIYGEQR